MTILSDIRYLVGIHIAQKGFPPSVVAPVLNILRLADEELRAVGYDFENPEVEKEAERLSQAIVMLTHSKDDEFIIEANPITDSQAIEVIEAELEEEDDLAWMDKLGDGDDD